MEAKDIILAATVGPPIAAAATFVTAFFLWLAAVFVSLIAEIVAKKGKHDKPDG